MARTTPLRCQERSNARLNAKIAEQQEERQVSARAQRPAEVEGECRRCGLPHPFQDLKTDARDSAADDQDGREEQNGKENQDDVAIVRPALTDVSKLVQ